MEGEDINIAKSRELHDLLSTFTPVEEAAIRPITPLISIVKLNNGGIGSKGNTSCVWQQSKLNLVLPNLPDQCNYIIVTRPSSGNSANPDNSNSGLKSTRFKRQKIQRALELLKQTNHKAWKDILISPENLSAWPVEGDICTVNPQMVVAESEDGNVIDSDGNVIGNLNVNVDSDGNGDDTGGINGGGQAVIVDGEGGDTGPAPLQNDVIPDETFEGVVNVVDQTETGGGNADMINAAVHDIVAGLRNSVGDGGTNRQSDEGRPVVALYELRPFALTEYDSVDDARKDLDISGTTIRESECVD